MKILTRILVIVILGSTAWLAWQKPAPTPAPSSVTKALPAKPAMMNAGNELSQRSQPERELWRVVTRRVISRDGTAALEKRLKAMGLKALKFKNREEITMHAFDDARLFQTSRAAWNAAANWEKHGIETTVIKTGEGGVWLVGLGRFYQAKYAEGMQQRLSRIGKKYRYQKRNVPIPAWRYTFEPMQKDVADKLWKQLDVTGVIMPVLMPESRFQELYGTAIRR